MHCQWINELESKVPGGSLVLLSVGLYASGWPEQIKGHPIVVLLIFAAGALLLGLGFWPGKKTEAHLSTAPSPAVSAPINVNVNPVFNNNPIQTNQQSAAPLPLPIPPIEPNAKSALQVLQPVFDQVTPVSGMWRLKRPGKFLGLIAWIHNPTAEEGAEGALYRNTRASIAFKQNGNLMFTIDTAHWLEESGYEIDLKPGTSKAILLALFPEGLSSLIWVSSKNERRDRVAAPRPGQIWNVSSPSYVSFGIPDEIEISIVSKLNTVRKVAFLVGRQSESSFYEFRAGDGK